MKSLIFPGFYALLDYLCCLNASASAACLVDCLTCVPDGKVLLPDWVEPHCSV